MYGHMRVECRESLCFRLSSSNQNHLLLHWSSYTNHPQNHSQLEKKEERTSLLYSNYQRHICHISNAVFLPQRVHWTIYTQHVYDFIHCQIGNVFFFFLTFQEFHMIIQHRHQKFNDFLDRASTVLTRQRLVTSILGLGSMGNVCYSKTKLSSMG